MSDVRTDLRVLRRDFGKKLDELQRKPESGIDDFALLPLMRGWKDLLLWANSANLEDEEVEHILVAARDAYAQQDVYGQLLGKAKRQSLAAINGYLEVFYSVFDALHSREVHENDFAAQRKILDDAREESQRAVAVMTYVTHKAAGLDAAVHAAEQAAEKAAEKADLAEKAATKTATGALEASFKTTADSSKKTAWWFRSATIFTLAVTVIFGLVYAGTSTAASVDNWHVVVYRVAILSALAGIAAYLGRQASNYHRLATWAQAIEIQLKAFRGFINEIDDEESRQTMFALFAKRVLESPPDGKASNDEVTNVIQPIIEQASRVKLPTT